MTPRDAGEGLAAAVRKFLGWYQEDDDVLVDDAVNALHDAMTVYDAFDAAKDEAVGEHEKVLREMAEDADEYAQQTDDRSLKIHYGSERDACLVGADALRERDAFRPGICTGCDTPRADAIAQIASGKAACCPDCSTLSVDDRNAIRAVARPRRIRAALAAPTQGDELEPVMCLGCGQSGTNLETIVHAFSCTRKGA